MKKVLVCVVLALVCAFTVAAAPALRTWGEGTALSMEVSYTKDGGVLCVIRTANGSLYGLLREEGGKLGFGRYEIVRSDDLAGFASFVDLLTYTGNITIQEYPEDVFVSEAPDAEYMWVGADGETSLGVERTGGVYTAYLDSTGTGLMSGVVEETSIGTEFGGGNSYGFGDAQSGSLTFRSLADNGNFSSYEDFVYSPEGVRAYVLEPQPPARKLRTFGLQFNAGFLGTTYKTTNGDRVALHNTPDWFVELDTRAYFGENRDKFAVLSGWYGQGRYFMNMNYLGWTNIDTMPRNWGVFVGGGLNYRLRNTHRSGVAGALGIVLWDTILEGQQVMNLGPGLKLDFFVDFAESTNYVYRATLSTTAGVGIFRDMLKSVSTSSNLTDAFLYTASLGIQIAPKGWEYGL